MACARKQCAPPAQVLTDSQFADRDGDEINGRIGARVKADGGARASRRRLHRLPRADAE